MRPLRSISRKNSVQKSTNVNTTTEQSRLLTQFSKFGKKNYERQEGGTRLMNYSKASMQTYHQRQLQSSQCYHKQSYNNNNNNLIQNTKSRVTDSQSNSPRINRISMTIEQTLQQKQDTIEHLKIQLQQSRYIISTLKHQIKQLSCQLLIIENKRMSGNHANCKNCINMNAKMQELEYLKDKRVQDNEFIQTYQELIQKLTQQIHLLQNQNHTLKSNRKNQDNIQSTFLNSSQIQITNPPNQQLSLKQNIHFFNSIKIIDAVDSLQQSRQSFDLELNSNIKKVPIISIKQNHPCTPKNNLPLSLSKNNLSGFKSANFASQNHNHQDENESKLLNQSKQIESDKSRKSKICQSPQKIKQKLIGRNDRKSISSINENLIQNQYEGFGIKMINNKLDRKIYF